MDNARHDAFNLIASSIDVTIVSLDKSSPIILEPPETLKTMGTLISGETDVRKIPL